MLILGYQALAHGGLTFEIAREDVAGDPMYFAYLNATGAWIIQRRDIAGGVYQYAQGTADLNTNWSGRDLLTYVEFNALIIAP